MRTTLSPISPLSSCTIWIPVTAPESLPDLPCPPRSEAANAGSGCLPMHIAGRGRREAMELIETGRRENPNENPEHAAAEHARITVTMVVVGDPPLPVQLRLQTARHSCDSEVSELLCTPPRTHIERQRLDTRSCSRCASRYYHASPGQRKEKLLPDFVFLINFNNYY